MKNDNNNLIQKILLSGEGGQGIQTLAKIIALSAFKSGKKICYLPEFGPEQRGAPSVAYIQIAEKKEIAYCRFSKADLIVILRERAVPVINKYIDKNSQILFDSSAINRRLIRQSDNKISAIPITKISKERLNGKNANLIVAGYLSHLLDLEPKMIWETISQQLSSKFKNPDEKNLAKKAFGCGYEAQVEKDNFSQPEFRSNTTLNIYKNHQKLALISPELCKGCGICVAKCPVGALKFGSNIGVYGNLVPEIDLKKCIACGNCFRFCPDCAIKVTKLTNKSNE